MRKAASTILAVAVLASLTSCDPDKVIGKYFASLGLNRLAVARDDILPAGVVVVNGSRAVYESSMYDWVSGEAPTVGVTASDKMKEYNAVIGSYSSDRGVDANAAVSLLKTVFPVDLSATLGLTNKVTIDLVNAKSQRLSPAQIQKFIQSEAAAPLRAHIAEVMRRKQKVFVIYEVYSSPKLKIASDSSSDVSATIKVGEVKPVASANGKFEVKRTTKSVLEVSGDHPYAFAIRTARVLEHPTVKGSYVLDVTDYPVPSTVKALGTDPYKYTAPLGDTFDVPIMIEKP
jgi:hypothetical protein